MAHKNIDLSIFYKSKFRMSFKLGNKEKEYIKQKGLLTIKQHAFEIIIKRLKPAHIPNDGKQTPYKGHPVFIAQHATATCCRKCLQKWHSIPQQIELSSEELEYVVSYIMKWIETQISQ